MEAQQEMIRDLDVEEREEIFINLAQALQGTAREAWAEGNRHFAMLSNNMAEAIRTNADELARDDPDGAERVLKQAKAMISQFNAQHPYRMLSMAVH
jgi:ABC-type Zn uptake system ZnuABC Zn-binding protein ZnuA